MVDTRLKGKVALIRGANHGIGAAAAVAFAREGADVFLTYLRLFPGEESAAHPKRGAKIAKPGRKHYYELLGRDAQDALEAIRALGGRSEAWEADLGNPDNIPRLMDRTEAAFGSVDILVNNAAHDRPDTFLPRAEIPATGLFGGEYPLMPITATSHDEHFAVNCRAVALLTAMELAPYEITVNVVSPGAVQTGWLTKEAAESLAKTYPLRRIGTPKDIARAVIFFASRQADWITGQVLYVGGGHRLV